MTKAPNGTSYAQRYDLAGHRFGRLVAVSYHKPGRWLCQCDCTETKLVATALLRNGDTRSCGCKKRDFALAGKPRLRHGHARATGHSSEYRSWTNMIRRCYQPDNNRFYRYGGRGITVCDRWRFGEEGKSGFECFLADMGLKPIGHRISIDRYPDNDGNYEPSNCRWATPKEQWWHRRAA